jgi:hypothetical protein
LSTQLSGGGISRIKAAFFDVEETIVDETREYGTWAGWLGVPRHTFSTVFGVVIARGGDYRDTFQLFRSGFDLGTARKCQAEAGRTRDLRWGKLLPPTHIRALASCSR